MVLRGRDDIRVAETDEELLNFDISDDALELRTWNAFSATSRMEQTGALS